MTETILRVCCFCVYPNCDAMTYVDDTWLLFCKMSKYYIKFQRRCCALCMDNTTTLSPPGEQLCNCSWWSNMSTKPSFVTELQPQYFVFVIILYLSVHVKLYYNYHVSINNYLLHKFYVGMNENSAFSCSVICGWL